MFRKPLILYAVASILIIGVASQPSLLVRADSTGPASLAQIGDLPQVDFDNVLQQVNYLSSLSSRVLGYDGFYEAAEYIKGYWASLGFDVHEEPFYIATPIVQKASLTVQKSDGQKVEIEAYPLWPNHINPCPYTSPEEGDKLVYVNRGLPEDFGDIDPAGDFVLMDSDNRGYWKNAATFGAKGVIFIESEETTSVQSVQKMFSIPLNFPRLYVRRETALSLKEIVLQQGEADIWVDSLMTWERKEVANLVAVVEGTDPDLKDQVAVIGAYYDSWSVVPQISPGATDSMGIAFLLEMSRLLAETRPERTIWLVAFAGHYQGLVGGREFVENHFSELETKLKMMLTLDLTSDSDIVAVYATGSMYGYSRPLDFVRYYDRWMRRIFEEWLPALEEASGETAHLVDGVLWARPSWIAASPPFEPSTRYFEAEVFTEACLGGGLGFVTTNAFRVYQYTPLNTFDRIQPENLRRQVMFLWPILYNSANMEAYYPLFPRRAGAIDHGLVSVTVQLAAYNKTTDWFDDYMHEDAIFLISVGPNMNPLGSIVAAGYNPSAAVGPSKSLVVQGVTAGLFAAPPIAGSGGRVTSGTLGTPIGFTTIVMPDAEGKVVVNGIKPLTGIDAQAYVLDPETGSIMSATDTGPFGTGKIRLGTIFGAASSAAAPTLTPGLGGTAYLRGTGVGARAFAPNVAYLERDVPIFNVSSIALLGLFDPWRITDPQGLLVEVYNFLSHSYFVWRDTLEPWPEAMVFVQPDSVSELIVRGSQNRIAAVLNNASKDNPQGQGYCLGHGETLILTFVDAARDTFHLADLRGGFLMTKMSSNPKLVLYLERLYGLKELAEEASGNGNKGELYSYTVAYWQYALQAYSASFVLLTDVVRTATFFFFLSAAFVLFLERLVTKRRAGMGRLVLIVTLFLATNIAISLVHPGYTISSNIWMLVNGLAVVLFSVLLLYIVTDEFNTAIKSISKSLLGAHRSDIERGSLLSSSLSMGVENLKKRPLRTGLALTTIAITISAMTLFTTMGVMIQSYRKPLGTPPYTGILLKRTVREAMNVPLSEQYLWAVKDIASEGLGELERNPRAWIYPPGQSMFFTWGAQYAGIRSLLAITAEEAMRLQVAVKPGMGVTFPPGMTKAVLIGETLASGLSRDLGIQVEPGAEISIYGVPVTVMGILDDEIASALLSQDLDQTFISPPDPIATSLTGIPTSINVTALIIVPYQFAMDYFNVQPNAISLSTESATFDERELWERSFDMVLTLPFDISYGIKELSIADTATTRDIYSLSGAENMIVPLLLSSLTLLSMMLSSVYERVREIRTLSTVGLSPRQIGAIFVVESIALAFVGSFLGYIVGAGVTSALWNLNLFPPGLVPNVSSGVVIIVMATMMAATMLSSIYPMVKASRLATPSLLRKWRIGSKPIGDRWSVSLPFTAAPDESLGVLAFMTEFLEASGSERTGIFMLLEPVQRVQEDERRLISARLQLSPFDAGIIQDFQVVSRPMAADRYGFEILITRIVGVEGLWTTANRALLDQFRRQFLFWRALDPDEKGRYIETARKRWAS